MAQRRPPLRAGDLTDVGRNLLVRPQVGTDENDARTRRRWHKTQTHGRSGQIADTPYLGRPREGPLIAITEPSHVAPVLSQPAKGLPAVVPARGTPLRRSWTALEFSAVLQPAAASLAASRSANPCWHSAALQCPR